MLQLIYRNTILIFEHSGKKTSALDSTLVRAAKPGSQVNSLPDPQIPIVSSADDCLVLDIEGLVANQDGTFVFLFVSDVYMVLKSSSVIVLDK